MNNNTIILGNFRFRKINGLKYLFDEEKTVTDYLFVKSQHEGFSMYFEDDFPLFTVPEHTERSYSLLEIKRPDRIIKFYCPEKHEKIDVAVWYFYVEIFDEEGKAHRLLGQVMVDLDLPFFKIAERKPKFIEVLEQVGLNKSAATA